MIGVFTVVGIAVASVVLGLLVGLSIKKSVIETAFQLGAKTGAEITQVQISKQVHEMIQTGELKVGDGVPPNEEKNTESKLGFNLKGKQDDR